MGAVWTKSRARKRATCAVLSAPAMQTSDVAARHIVLRCDAGAGSVLSRCPVVVSAIRYCYERAKCVMCIDNNSMDQPPVTSYLQYALNRTGA